MLFAFGPHPEPRQDDEFRQFWQVYPRHVAVLAAQKAFTKARKVASLQIILDGVERYKRTKPAYADYCHPATWLNQGRWMDEPDAKPQPDESWRCQHQPRCHNAQWHQVVMARERGEV